MRHRYATQVRHSSVMTCVTRHAEVEGGRYRPRLWNVPGTMEALMTRYSSDLGRRDTPHTGALPTLIPAA